MIGVQSALYGRKDRETCSEGRPNNQLTVTDCSQMGTVDIIKKRYGFLILKIQGATINQPFFAILLDQ